ncbi:MAG: hypothetical protein APF84_11230 [Gracilibacter sp. BRH_c7a]|nr:MAG: hypothetical protein APF84_11230 [Gracilibacter sp. BRH_c7a]
MKLAIFDFDGTLFPKDTLPYLLTRRKYLKCSRFTIYKIYISLIPLFFQYKLGLFAKLSREEMKLQAVRKFNPIFNGMNEQELKDFFMICSQEVQGLFNKSVLKEVQKARDEGFHTVLLSGTYHEFLQNIGDQLEFDTVIGSQMYFNHGKYDSKKETEIVIGDLKLKKIIERFGYEEVDWEASRAYADGYSDLKLLQAVGQPIVVNPDAKLKAVAIDKKWMILF